MAHRKSLHHTLTRSHLDEEMMTHTTIDTTSPARLPRAWEALLDANHLLESEASQLQLTRLIARQLEVDEATLSTRWMPAISRAFSSNAPILSHAPHVAEVLATHLGHDRVRLSDEGRLLAWCEAFSRRTDIKVRHNLHPSTRVGRATDEPAYYSAMATAFEHFMFEWRFERSAMRQRHIIPPEIEDALTQSGADMHGHLSLQTGDPKAWRQEIYPNNWKVVDHHASASLRIGRHGPHEQDEIYLVAYQDAPRSEAYLAATTFVDGGSFGGIPACMAQTRYRDLNTFFTMGARRGFAMDWTIIEPIDQDFGAFAEVERQMYIPSYFERDPEEDARPCSAVEDALRRHSAPKDLDEHELRTRLMDTGASHFITEQLWQWLAEDIALLIEN